MADLSSKKRLFLLGNRNRVDPEAAGRRSRFVPEDKYKPGLSALGQIPGTSGRGTMPENIINSIDDIASIDDSFTIGIAGFIRHRWSASSV